MERAENMQQVEEGRVIEREILKQRTRVENCLRGDGVGHQEVMDEFDSLGEDIGSAELSGDLKGKFKFQMYSLKVLYLESLYEKTDAQEKSLIKAKRELEKFRKYEQREEVEEKSNQEFIEVAKLDPQQADLEAHIDTLFRELGGLLAKEVLSYLQEKYVELSTKNIETVSEYESVLVFNIERKRIFTQIESDLSQREDRQDLALTDVMIQLKYVFDVLIKGKSFKFVDYLLEKVQENSRNPLLLDPEVCKNEESVKKVYRKLFLLFHPDKFFPENRDPVEDLAINDLFRALREAETLQLGVFKEPQLGAEELDMYRKQAFEHWQLTLDYKDAIKRDWAKLRVLKKSDVDQYEEKQLESLRNKFSVLAYEDYRVCCKIADKAHKVPLQMEFRRSMSLCLYLSKDYLGAQLYALSAVRLAYKHSNEATHIDLEEAIKVLRHVQGTAIKELKPNTHEHSVANSENIRTLVEVKSGQLVQIASNTPLQNIYSHEERHKMRVIADEALEEVSKTLVLKPESALVSYSVATSDILKAKQFAHRYKVIGMVAGAEGILVGGAMIVPEAVEIGTTIVAIANGTMTGSALLGPLCLAGVGLASIGVGIWFGIKMYNRSNELLKEPVIREKLNQIMEDAVKYYEAGEYQESLEALSRPYAEIGDSLVNLKGRGDGLNPKTMSNCLLSHGFRPDGIVFLLNMLGTILLSGQIKIKGITQDDLAAQALLLFSGAMYERFDEEAKILDDRVCEFRKESLRSKFRFKFISSLRKLIDAVSLKDHSAIAEEHLNDAGEKPFQARLAEVRNITQLNLLVQRIVNGKPDAVEDAKRIMQEVRNAIFTHYQFMSFEVNRRLEILEDLFWVMCAEEVPLHPILLLKSERHEQMERIVFQDSQYLVFLVNSVNNASNIPEKIDCLLNLSGHLTQLAEEEQIKDKQKSLVYWHKANKVYTTVLELAVLADPAALSPHQSLVKRWDPAARPEIQCCGVPFLRFSHSPHSLAASKPKVPFCLWHRAPPYRYFWK